MKKIIVIPMLLLSPLFILIAESNRKAIDMFLFDLKEPAKKTFLQNIQIGSLTPLELAEAHYYLGEIFFSENNYDSAKQHFSLGTEADPSFLMNEVGLIKMALVTSPKDVEEMLKTLTKGKNKKNTELQFAVAKAFLDAGLTDRASDYISIVKKLDSKYAPLFVLEGDLLNIKNELGKACSMYEQAIYFDASYKPAYIRYARNYARSNPSLAINMLQKMADTDPSSFMAYREIGDIYYKNGQFDKAAEAFEKYIKNSPSFTDDYAKYATILFFKGDLSRSKEIARQGLKEDSENFVLNRILLYNLCEQKEYEEGYEVANRLMKQKNQDFISLDHLYYARLLHRNNKSAEAISCYEIALSLDPSKTEIYKEVATVYENMEQYDDAIRNYDLYMKENNKQVMVADYFTLGKIYYSAVTNLVADTLNTTDNKDKITEYAQAADSLFFFVAERAPESYLGNFWRARINSVLDPESEQGLAKPYYELSIKLIAEKSPSEIRNLIEYYSYMGYYYYLQNDKEKSREYWNKIIQLDPNSKVALDALKSL